MTSPISMRMLLHYCLFKPIVIDGVTLPYHEFIVYQPDSGPPHL